MSIDVTLLPPNAEPAETAYAGSGAHHLTLDFPIEHLWNAQTCPAEYLPWLAWSLSVDVWNDAWDEARKRRAIAEAPEQHRIKGTVKCVKQALSLLGCRTVIREWWQQTPPGVRGTFKIIAYVTERLPPYEALITQQRIDDAIRAVMASKPKSRSFSMEMHAGVDGTLGLAGRVSSTALSVARGNTRIDTRTAGTVAVAGRIAATAILSATARLGAPPLRGGLALAGRASGISISFCSGRAI